MNVMIFAAGYGTRLRPLTDQCPKALIDVGGKTMLERVILKIKEAGLRRIVVNVHHHADMIEDFLRANGDFGVDIAISNERELLLDTGGALVHALPYLTNPGPVLVHNADILTDFPIEEMIERHDSSQSDATLLVASRATSRYLLFDSNLSLCGWVNTSTGVTKPAGINVDDYTKMAFGGVHIINRQMIEEMSKTVMEPVFPIVPCYIQKSVSGGRVSGFVPSQSYMWHDIGKPSTLEAARRELEK